jgi:formate-nitrite transporter family protein
VNALQRAVSAIELDMNSTAQTAGSEPAQTSYQAILEHEITEGLREIERPTTGLVISGVSAGLDVSLSVFLMAVIMTLARGELNNLLIQMLVAAMYGVGFIVVILGRSELFTEHTTRAVYPVLHRRASIARLLRLWGLIYLSNLAGTAGFAWLISIVGPSLGVVDAPVFGKMASQVVNHPGWLILLSGALAGWLMGLVSWLVSAARDTTSQILIVGTITWSIGIAHLHHAIVGSVEVLTGIFAHQGLGLRDYCHFLLWTTLGNTAGGVVFVALFKYSHATRRAAEAPPVSLDETPSRIITDLSTPDAAPSVEKSHPL